MIQYSRDLDTGRKLKVEYWADGPDSELPPGHWGLFAQWVSQRDGHSIAQDVKMFFAMHNASFDAGIVAWHIKRKYNGVRPITAIRFPKRTRRSRSRRSAKRRKRPGCHVSMAASTSPTTTRPRRTWAISLASRRGKKR